MGVTQNSYHTSCFTRPRPLNQILPSHLVYISHWFLTVWTIARMQNHLSDSSFTQGHFFTTKFERMYRQGKRPAIYTTTVQIILAIVSKKLLAVRI